jgi:hypothetical protein
MIPGKINSIWTSRFREEDRYVKRLLGIWSNVRS